MVLSKRSRYHPPSPSSSSPLIDIIWGDTVLDISSMLIFFLPFLWSVILYIYKITEIATLYPVQYKISQVLLYVHLTNFDMF